MAFLSVHLINLLISFILSLFCTCLFYEFGMRDGISIILVGLTVIIWLIFTFIMKKNECCCSS